MRTIVKTRKFFEETAKLHGCVHVLDRLAEKIKDNPEYQLARFSFEGDFHYQRIRNLRVIYASAERKVKGEKVRCLLALAVLKMGSSEWWEFNNQGYSRDARGKFVKFVPDDWEAVWSEIEHEPAPPPPPPLPSLTPNEQAFIHRDRGYVERAFEYPVYETRQWVDKVVGKEFGDPFKVGNKLDQFITEIECGASDMEIRGRELFYGKDSEDEGEGGGQWILLWRLRQPEPLENGVSQKKKEHKYGWFLIGLGSKEELARVKEELKHVLEDGEEHDRYDRLVRECRRIYPFDMLSDIDRWGDMEESRDGNLVLSDEELDIVAEKLTFPLFVTGRAGSGKSTMLQYLMADYFLRFIDSAIANPPVYLSYSKDLVGKARDLAGVLFKNNHAFSDRLKRLGVTDWEEMESRLDDSFSVFGKLVRKCIEQTNKAVADSRFNPDRHVSFSDFRTRWEERFREDPRARRDYGPELSWHVIRSYIKGWDCESFCEPEDYKSPDFGKKYKSVTEEVFEAVYNKVWSWYQELQKEEGLWDDQDLVRYCLAPDDDCAASCVTPCYSAVFCDESQDFTRIEIDFILRLSIYSRRNIEGSLAQLPFVFVGDEFQTLNPTGFSWDSLRSYFTERLCELTRCKTKLRAPDPIVLQKNYRSTQPIVKLANRVQLLRQTRCGDESYAEPQISYYAEDQGDSVYCLDAGNPAVWEYLRQQSVCLVVPSSEGETPCEFFQGTPVEGMIEYYEDGTPKFLNVCNPTQVKGMEFPCVAVYGFDLQRVLPDELRLDKLSRWYDRPGDTDSDASKIALKYFLSNVYVASTRAQRQLFILADPMDRGFWNFALSKGDSDHQRRVDDLEHRMLCRLKNPGSWDIGQTLGFAVEGSIDQITSVGDVVSAREAAGAMRDRGMQLHDLDLLRQAAARFNEQRNAVEATRCEAWMYYYTPGQRAFRDAAAAFLRAGDKTEAVECYWRDCRLWRGGDNMPESLAEIAKNWSDTYPTVVQLAKMAGGATIELNALHVVLERVRASLEAPEDNRERRLLGQTRPFLAALLNTFLLRLPRLSADDQDNVEELDRKLSALEFDHEIIVSPAARARRCYEVNLGKRAIELWEHESFGDRQNLPRQYYKAKVQLEKYPACLKYLPLTGDDRWQERAALLCKRNGGLAGLASLSCPPEVQAIAYDALFRKGNKEDAGKAFAWLLVHCQKRSQAQELLREGFEDRGIVCSKVLCEAVLDVKFGLRLRTEDVLGHKYHINENPDAKGLARVLRKVDTVRGPQFLEKVDSALEARRRVDDFMEEEIGSFRLNSWSPLLYVELGGVMERRRYYIDAARYYEWARKQLDDPHFKEMMDLRWLACKERQAGNANGVAAAEAQREAAAKRLQLGLGKDVVLPLEPAFAERDWLDFLDKMLEKIPQDTVSTPFESAAEKPVPAESVPAESVPAESVPAEPVPAESVPAESVPAESVPAEPVPAESVPAEPVPAESVPAEPVPVEPVPAEPVPAEPVPCEPAPAVSPDADDKTFSSALHKPQPSALGAIGAGVVGRRSPDWLFHPQGPQSIGAPGTITDYNFKSQPPPDVLQKSTPVESMLEKTEPPAPALVEPAPTKAEPSVPAPVEPTPEPLEEAAFLKSLAAYVDRCGFKFRPCDIARFHTSVKCGFCTLLAGLPGRGKSSLAELYMRAMAGADASAKGWLRVNVSPAWLDPSDLLGFERDGGFVEAASGLAGYLRGRSESPRIGLVCLEEMNLACIEHYFADFIQLMDRDLSDPQRIPGCMKGGSELMVGDNIRMIGTCNDDESTRAMSPRFLNRCNVIEVGQVAQDELIDGIFAGATLPRILPFEGVGPMAADLRRWLDEASRRSVEDRVRDVVKTLARSDELKEADLALSPRVLVDAVTYVKNRLACGDERADDVQMRALDEFLMQRVFFSCKPIPSTDKAISCLKNLLEKNGLTQSGHLLDERIRAYNALTK